MNQSIAIAGRVCLCEWSGPVSVAMVVSLLSQLKRVRQGHGGACILILHMHPSSATSIMKCSSTFLDVMPALWSHCQEIIVVCQGETGILDQLRRTLCGSTSTPISMLARPLGFFELLDEAFAHVQGVYPHDALEIRRRRLRSGTWAQNESLERKCRS